MKIIIWLISALASFPATILAILYFFFLEMYKAPSVSYTLVLGIIIATLITFILRSVIHTERPDPEKINKAYFHNRLSGRKLNKLKEYVRKIKSRSFASNHVARVGVFLSVLYFNKYPSDWLISLALFMVLIGVTRILLKKHRFTEVIIGAVLGILSGYASFFILSRSILF